MGFLFDCGLICGFNFLEVKTAVCVIED
jgi:hypothetical protein